MIPLNKKRAKAVLTACYIHLPIQKTFSFDASKIFADKMRKNYYYIDLCVILKKSNKMRIKGKFTTTSKSISYEVYKKRYPIGLQKGIS